MASGRQLKRRERASTRHRYSTLIVVLALLLGACGGTGSESTTTTEDTATTEGQTDTTAQPTTTEATSGDAFVDELVAQGYADVGLVQQPPFSGITPEGEPEGLCPTLVAEGLAGLEIPQIEMVAAEYADMIPGLQSDRWDIAGACLRITPERCEEVIFSDPVNANPFSFAVPPGNPEGITSVADLAANPDLTVGLQTGSSELQRLLDLGVQESQIVEFPDVRSSVEGLTAGRVDSALTATIAFEDLGEPDGYELTDTAPDIPLNPSGVAFRPEDEGLRDAFNEQLAAMMEDGRFAEISEGLGFIPEAVEGQSTEALCAGES